MPRRALTVVTVFASLALAGCGGGPVVPEVRPSATTAPADPRPGSCYRAVTAVSYPGSDVAVDCAKVHRAETVTVRSFTGTAAAEARPPQAGSAGSRATFRACDADAKRYVGADWRGARLSVQVVVPAPESWAAGSRWFRCDLFELATVDGGRTHRHPDDTPVARTGSLKGALTADRPPAYTCFTESGQEFLRPADCDRPHQAEYAGVWTAPEMPHDDVERNSGRLLRECRSVVASYVKGARRVGTGVLYRAPSPEAWQRGDRGIRCFLSAKDGDLAR